MNYSRQLVQDILFFALYLFCFHSLSSASCYPSSVWPFLCYVSAYSRPVRLNLFRSRSPLPSTAAFPGTLVWMHGRHDSNYGTSNVNFITKQRYLLRFIHSMLSAMRQIVQDLQAWFDYRLCFAKCFFRFISTCTIWKEARRRGFFISSHLRLMNGGNLAVCTNIRAVAWKTAGTCLMNDECLFFKWLPVWRRQTLVAIFNTEKHALSRRLMARFFTFGKKISILHSWASEGLFPAGVNSGFFQGRQGFC